MRIAIQDRRRLFREGLCMLLAAEPDIEIVGAVATPAELIELCDREELHAVVLQTDAALAEAARAVAVVRRRHRRMRIVAVYGAIERPQATEMNRAGVDVLVPSGAGVEPLLQALRNGSSSTDISWFDTPVIPAAQRLAPLTDREREVLRMVGTGHTTREISVRLGISAKTVENHKHRIFSKLGVHNQAHAVSIAMRAGILTPSTVGSAPRAAAQ